ncbi:restriction endonuclease [Scytonema sp. NUACC26]|uniref:restriction endonuclease n=1 Tax=Scytonema sp. NUACC26 TaxID=3140176 RepID=UPI0034DC95A8
MIDKLVKGVAKEVTKGIIKDINKIPKTLEKEITNSLLGQAITQVEELFIKKIILIITKLLGVELKKAKDVDKALAEIDKISGREFEEFLAKVFKLLGYKVLLTQEKGDFGADLVVQKNSVKTVVQAKRYKGNVGVDAVYQVVGALGYYKADKSMVITNSKFTTAARELAAPNKVQLWDRDDLKSLLEKM